MNQLAGTVENGPTNLGNAFSITEINGAQVVAGGGDTSVIYDATESVIVLHTMAAVASGKIDPRGLRRLAANIVVRAPARITSLIVFLRICSPPCSGFRLSPMACDECL